MNAFDFVNAINANKDIISESDSPELAEKQYTPFLTNKALSYHNDTLMLANEMNMRPLIDNKLQFAFYLNTIRPRKRFSKWFKPDKVEAIELVKEYYGYNNDRAAEAVSILSDEDINTIRKLLYKGGEHGR